MGHITITHPNIEQARSLAQKVKETIKVISKQ
jgi:phosphoribosylaminoimidazole carboxylase, ATPase subunit